MFCLSFVLLVCMFFSFLSRLCYQVIPGRAFNNFLQSMFIKFYILDVMLKSQADSTTKAYVRVIRKFLD